MGLISSPDGVIDYQNYRPSNIKTGYIQQYFGNIEKDAILHCFIDIFKNNGNTWEIPEHIFEYALLKKNIQNAEPISGEVYDAVLEIVGKNIKLKDAIIQELLREHYRRSIRAAIYVATKKLFTNLNTN